MAITLNKKILPLLLIAGASAVTFLLYLNRPSSEIIEPVYVPVTIDVSEVVKEDLRIPIQAQGTVTPLRETTLVSEVNGSIVETSPAFNVGGYISKGDILLRIDPRNYQTRLLQAQAALESANSSLAQEKGRAQVALKEWEKLPAGSQRSQAAKDLYLRKPQMGQAEAQYLAATADMNTARDDLERTIIRAPYDALISQKSSELGQYVGTGTPLAEVFSVDYAEVRLAVPQSKLAYIDLPSLASETSIGTKIDLYTDVSGTISHWDAQMDRTEGTYDERSRVLFTVARIKDPYALVETDKVPLRIGTFVNANIEGKLQKDLVALPRYILRAGNHVWVVDEGMQLRNRKISILRTGGDTMYVTAGLENGDLVSLTALDSTFAGSTVNIVSRTSTSKKKASTQAPQAAEFKPGEPDAVNADSAITASKAHAIEEADAG
ncbi:MAG: efflux RND transporter periplasmic adaptor subunit [Halioglobus sp.]